MGYLGSKFKQRQMYSLVDDTASLVVVDWFTCGRGKQYSTHTNGRKNVETNGRSENEGSATEFWGQQFIQSDMKVIRNGKVILIDNLLLEGMNENNYGPSISERVDHADVFGVVVLVGERIKSVADKLHLLCARETFYEHSSKLVGQKRKITNITENDAGENASSKGPIYSFSRIGDEKDAFVFRFAAYSVESGYILLASILSSIKESTGVAPYEDRLQGVEYMRNY